MFKNLQSKVLLLIGLLLAGVSNVLADEVTDVLTRELTGVTGTSYTTWSEKTANSNAVYAGQSAGGNESIQLRSNNNNSGVVTTASGGKAKSITVEWHSKTGNGRTLNVYGKNTAYKDATDLYNTNNQGTLLGTIVCGTSTSLTITGDYEYIGFRSNSGAMYLTSVTIVWEAEAEVPQVLESIALSGEYPTTFHVGDDFSHEGMVVTATYESEKTADVTEQAVFTGYNMANKGVQTVTVSYTENDVTKSATYDINVLAPAVLSSITLTGDYPTEFQQGDAFSHEGIVVTANYDDETTKDVTEEAVFTGYDMASIGEQTVTVSYTENEVTKTATYGITVVEKKGTDTNPYTVAEAIAYINTLGNATSAEEVYVSGIISQVDSYNSKYSSITYWISDDGTTTNQMEVYSGKGLNGADFSALEDLKVGDIVTVKGYVKMYNSTPEFDKNNQLVSYERPVITTPYIELSANSVEVAAAGAEGTITVAYNNIKDVAAEVRFYEADGTTAAEYDWIVAEINQQTNNVDYIIAENESTEARTAYMKVYALDDEAEDVYSELITISQAGYVVDYATLPFRWDDKNTPTGITNNGVGTYNGSPYLKFDNTGDYIILKINETPGTLTFDMKGNSFSDGTFTVQASTDGVSFEDLCVYLEDKMGSNTRSELIDLDADVRYIKWVYTEKVTGNVALGNIVLTAPMSVALNSYGYATYASEYALDFSAAEANGYSAWAVSKIDGNAVKFIKITESVPAETGVLLMGGESANVSIKRATTSTFNGTNLLKGITEDTKVTSGQYYGLSGNNFVRVGDTTIPAGKALLPANLIGNNNARLAFVFEDEATGIENISQEETVKAMFDLQGRKVQKAGRGVYVVNGKKVVKK